MSADSHLIELELSHAHAHTHVPTHAHVLSATDDVDESDGICSQNRFFGRENLYDTALDQSFDPD